MVPVSAGRVVRAARVAPMVLVSADRLRPAHALRKEVPAAPEDLAARGAEAVLLQNP